MSRSIDRATARKSRRSEKKDNRAVLLQAVEETRRVPVRASRAPLKPLTEAQRVYGSCIRASRVTFGIGPAGTGKTWFAAALAAEALQAGDIKTIVIVRPAVEAGENLGFLPGDLNEKVDPFMRPIYDALSERMGSSAMEYAIKAGAIEVRPLAFLRGSTLKDCWVLADEMQNTTPAQMKMFLTRIGENSRFIVNGDLSQTDIEGPSGLADALRRLDGLRFVSKVEFTTADIVRDPICQAIAACYEKPRPVENDGAQVRHLFDQAS